MSDINQVITLGIGTPASIPYFITLGLRPKATGFIALDARPRLDDLDVDARVIDLDMDSRDD